MNGKGMSKDMDRPVKGKRDGVVTGNEGAKGGPDACYSGVPSTDGYTKKWGAPLHSPEMTKHFKSGGEQ